MYLDYSAYTALTLDPVTSTEYTVLEPEAEVYVDEWTYGRLSDYDTIPDEVMPLIAKLVDALKTASGTEVKSYSNGTDTWNFSAVAFEDMEERLHRYALAALPVELVSSVR